MFNQNEIKSLREERAAVCDEMKSLVDAAEQESRNLTPSEKVTFDALKLAAETKKARYLELEEKRDAFLKSPEVDQAVAKAAREYKVPYHPTRADSKTYLTRSDSYADFAREERGYLPPAKSIGFGDVIANSLQTGRTEYRITTTSGSTGLISQLLFPEFVDLFRAKSVAFEAGCVMLPLEGENTTWARPKLTADPTASWRAESGTISQSTATIAKVIWTPKSLSALVKVSREALQDLPALNEVLDNAFAAAFASAADKAMIGVTTAANSPSGILESTSANSTAVSAVMSDSVVESAIERLLEANVPTENLALVAGTRDYANFQTQIDSQNQPLQRSRLISETNLKALGTSAIALTTSSTASAIVGNFSDGVWGMREDLTMVVLDQRYGENGDIGIVGHLRGDFQINRAASFELLTGITT